MTSILDLGSCMAARRQAWATSQRINALIDSALVEQNRQQAPRNYLGGSRIGEPCARKLVFELTNVPVDEGKGFDGRMLRIFDAGHQFEDLSIRWLRAAGFDLRDKGRDGGQFGFSIAGGRIRGHIDGVIVAGPDVGIRWPALFEHKSLNAKSWSKIRQSAASRLSKPIYCAQVQIYMAYMDLGTRAVHRGRTRTPRHSITSSSRFDPPDGAGALRQGGRHPARRRRWRASAAHRLIAGFLSLPLLSLRAPLLGRNNMSAALQSGVRIGRLTLLQEGEPLVSASGRRRRRWLCRCDCGTQTLVLAQNLSLAARRPQGGSRSCGCLARERAVRHGEISANRPSPEYAAWIAAKKRCFNPRNASFRNYGGRGITMCSRWTQNFEAFLRDMGRRPGPGYSLDRIDTNRGYEPGNCRWADSATQNRNRRLVRFYGFDGSVGILSDWATYFGVTRDQLRALLRRKLVPLHRLPPEAIDPTQLTIKPVLDLNVVAPLGAPNPVLQRNDA